MSLVCFSKLTSPVVLKHFCSNRLQKNLEKPDGSAGKESACNRRDRGDGVPIPGSARFPGGGNGKLLQYSCLENFMDREAWQSTIQRVAKTHTGTTEQLNTDISLNTFKLISKKAM